MPNRAAILRQKINDVWPPGAAVMERGRNYLRLQHPTEPNRFGLFPSMAGVPLHYGIGEDQEIDTTWIDAAPADAPWLKKMIFADYNCFAGPGALDFDAGQIIKYIDPLTGADVAFQPQQLQWSNDLDQIQAIANPASVTGVIDDDTISWSAAFGPGIDFKWIAHPAKLIKQITVNSLADIGTPNATIIAGGNPVLRVQFIFQKSPGVEIWIDGAMWDEKPNSPISTTSLIEFRVSGEIVWIFNPALIDDDTTSQVVTTRFRKTGNNLFVEVRVPRSLLETVSYPLIIDPTIGPISVATSADDGSWEAGVGGFANTAVTHNLTTNEDRHFYRFTGISGITGATINAASYFTAYFRDTESAAPIDVYMEDAQDPTAVASQADGDGRSLTTATVQWSVTVTGNNYAQTASGDMTSLLQELVDTHNYDSAKAMQAFLHWVDTTVRIRGEDHGGATEAQLYIDYTAAAAGQPMPIRTQGVPTARRDRPSSWN